MSEPMPPASGARPTHLDPSADAPSRDRSDWPVRVYTMGEPPPDWEHWLARPIAERLAAGEELRRRYYGADYDDLQMALVARVFKGGQWVKEWHGEGLRTPNA